MIQEDIPLAGLYCNFNRCVRLLAQATSSYFKASGAGIGADELICLSGILLAPENTTSLGALQNVLGLPRTNVADVVNRLEKLGLLTKIQNTEDGRTVDVALTAAGEDFMTEWAQPLHDASMKAMVNIFGEEKSLMVINELLAISASFCSSAEMTGIKLLEPTEAQD